MADENKVIELVEEVKRQFRMEKPEEVEEKLVDSKFENIESKSNIIDEEESIEV